MGWIEAADEFHNNVRAGGHDIGEVLRPLNGIRYRMGVLALHLAIEDTAQPQFGSGRAAKYLGHCPADGAKTQESNVEGKGDMPRCVQMVACFAGPGTVAR